MFKSNKAPYSTVDLPDGIVIGGEWPNTLIAWPGGKSRSATKPEHDLFQALEKMQCDNIKLQSEVRELRDVIRRCAEESASLERL